MYVLKDAVNVLVFLSNKLLVSPNSLTNANAVALSKLEPIFVPLFTPTLSVPLPTVAIIVSFSKSLLL